MLNAIRRCEMEMTLAVLRAIESGVKLEIYPTYYEGDYDGWMLGNAIKVDYCVADRIVTFSKEKRKLFREVYTIERGPWLPGAIAQVERELEGVK